MDALNLMEDEVAFQVTGLSLVDLQVELVHVTVQELRSQLLIRIDG